MFYTQICLSRFHKFGCLVRVPTIIFKAISMHCSLPRICCCCFFSPLFASFFWLLHRAEPITHQLKPLAFFSNGLVYIVCKARAFHEWRKTGSEREKKQRMNYQNIPWNIHTEFGIRRFGECTKKTSIEAKLCGKHESIIAEQLFVLPKKLFQTQGKTIVCNIVKLMVLLLL